MKKIQIKDIWLFVAQVLLLSLTLLSPGLISYVTSHNPQLAWESLTVSTLAKRLSTYPMDTLQHSAALSLKGRSSNSQFASIYSHVGNVLFPAWENIIPSLGTNNSFKGSHK